MSISEAETAELLSGLVEDRAQANAQEAAEFPDQEPGALANAQISLQEGSFRLWLADGASFRITVTRE